MRTSNPTDSRSVVERRDYRRLGDHEGYRGGLHHGAHVGAEALRTRGHHQQTGPQGLLAGHLRLCSSK